MTLLPNKHSHIKHSYLGLGALILKKLDRPSTINGLWERCRDNPDVASFERFTVALDMLFMLGAIKLNSSSLVRSHD